MVCDKNITAVLLVFTFLCCASGVSAENESESIAKLHVRGEAQLMVPPDQAAVVLGVVTEAKTAKQAVQSNTKKMRSVINAIQQLGLTENDYRTQQFRVQPVWSSRPKIIPSGWKSEIVAYRVENQLQITTQQLEIVGDLVGVATGAGANNVRSISFGLLDERRYRARAITEAMDNARIDAQTLATASGNRIKRTLSLNLDNASASKVHVQTDSFLEKRSVASLSAATPPPIQSGDITVRASVSVVYELEAGDNFL